MRKTNKKKCCGCHNEKNQKFYKNKVIKLRKKIVILQKYSLKNMSKFDDNKIM